VEEEALFLVVAEEFIYIYYFDIGIAVVLSRRTFKTPPPAAGPDLARPWVRRCLRMREKLTTIKRLEIKKESIKTCSTLFVIMVLIVAWVSGSAQGV
jgi:hypothetical protein